jgi:AAA+ ATPase superfamily predicted ATPase
MQITKFINRLEEIKLLNDKWKKNNAQFIIIYGRRRVGKTELIKQFIKNKKGIYFLGRLESKKDQLERISEHLSDFFSDSVINTSPLNSWEAVFEYITNKNEKFIFAIDEFPYVVKTSPEILSIIQEYWDEKLKKSKIFFILCGSSLSMMEKYIFDYSTPIYGRRTFDIKVPPLSFNNITEFFPKNNIEENIKIYSILGGTPAYQLEYEKNIDDTIKKIISKQSFLLREPEFILREEVNEPRLFISILHAISIGKTSVGEITNQTGLDRGIVGKYISVLIDLDLIIREVPVTESWKSRKGNYYIKDNFFNFWFRFIYPNLHHIELNPVVVENIIKKELDSYIGRIFEDICKQFLIKNKLFASLKIGKWWYKDEEIDIVGLNEDKKEINFFECKWKKLSYDQSLKILKKLKDKSVSVKWLNDTRKEYYGIFAKKIEKKDEIKKQGYFAYDLDDWK